MLKKILIIFYLLYQVDCYLVTKNFIILKQTYNGKFIENYKYNKKKFKFKKSYFELDK